MDDDELNELRARRLAEMQQNQAGGEGGGGRGGGGGGGREQKEEESRRQQEEMRNSILSQILDQQARARLNTISIAKPDKAQMVESLLINMARSGQLMGKLGEEELIGLLEKVSQQTEKQKPKVNFDRRRAALDDDDD